MAVVVRRLAPALGERDELVAQVDERHTPRSSAQLEVEEATVERECLLEVSHLESDVVHAQQAWAARHPGSVGRDWPKTPETLDVSFLRIS